MIIKAKYLITGDGKTVMENAALYITGSLIEEIGNVKEVCSKYSNEQVVDYGDAAILPGLIDMHVHIGGTQSHLDSDAINDYTVGFNGLDFVQRALKSGVTTLRDVSGPDLLCQSIIYAANREMLDDIPRIIYSNKAVCATGGHGWNHGLCTEADGEDGIRRAVREQIRAGAQWIKIMTSHRSPGVSEYTQDELNVAVDEARRHKRKIAAHSSLQPSLEYCVNAGVDTIEHGTDLTEEQIRRMVDKNITWVPTLLIHRIVLENMQKILDDKGKLNERQKETYDLYKYSNEVFKKNFKTYANLGVNIVTGTDMIIDGTAPVAAELALMAEYGMDNISAIAAGTSKCAKVLGMEGEIGLLAKGAIADILVVEGNPLDNIKSLQNVKAVYFSGNEVNVKKTKAQTNSCQTL